MTYEERHYDLQTQYSLPGFCFQAGFPEGEYTKTVAAAKA